MCCDGTWNTAGQRAVTNVRRLYNALDDTAPNGTEQLSHYQPGVGTSGLLGWLPGGVVGFGLSRNVIEAYQWLTTTYRTGDRVALFGFSRGAYTARSLAGMIAACGLIDTTGLDEDTVWQRIEHVYRRRYMRGRRADADWGDGMRFLFDPERVDQLPVDFIGVWDTVGSLGIPDTLGWLNLLDPARRYGFHDVRLNPQVRHARHALALDENRGPFTPTLWSSPAPDQDVEQVWFPGSHMDVGGGHPETGLSDCALRWMIDEARSAVGLEFREGVEKQIQPDPLGVLHDDNQGGYGALEVLYEPLLRSAFESFLEPRPRATPLIDPNRADPALDSSVYTRYETPPITGGPYRPTHVLEDGQSVTVDVVARDPWNWTGIYLEAGEYRFTATGQWVDLNIPSGPAGTTGWSRYRPREAGRLLGTLIGQGERLFRRLTRNPMANFILTRRDEGMPWFALIGVVANDATPVGGDQALHEHIPIGAGTSHQVSRPGYLYAFANDAWSFYGNNHGSVALRITRTA